MNQTTTHDTAVYLYSHGDGMATWELECWLCRKTVCTFGPWLEVAGLATSSIMEAHNRHLREVNE